VTRKIKQEDVNRLYFVIRSWIMGQIGGLIFLSIVWFLGSIDFFQAIMIGAFVFVISLIISRLLDRYINKGTRRILRFLSKHTRIKRFILKYF